MYDITHEPTRVLATDTTEFELRQLVSEEAIVFAALTVVLLVTGAVSGIVGVTALAALTGFAAAAITITHTAKTLGRNADEH